MTDEVFEKSENQLDKIDESVEQTISDMATVWKKCTDKLASDCTCFICKRQLDNDEKFDLVAVPHEKYDKGLYIMASICKKCNK